MKLIITESQINKINEEIFWDRENLNALKSMSGTKQEKDDFTVEVFEPFTITIRDSIQYHRLIHILRTN